MARLKAFNPAKDADDNNEMVFTQLADFNTGAAGVFWSMPGGPSPWEMHPDTEELLQILEGEIEVEVLPRDGGAGQKVVVTEGSCLVVPKGCWHRQTINKRTKEFYVTPGDTLHSHAEDPRVE